MNSKNKFLTCSFIVLLTSLLGCQNFDQEFPDYKYTTVYFPYQYPQRTLILGDDKQVDTANDNLLQFSIGINMGGVYSNANDRTVSYVIDTTLTKNLYTSTSAPVGFPIQVLPLPKSYYNYQPSGTIVIPKGSMQGYMKIQLTDAFLNDPYAIGMKYVIPVRITNAEKDSVLQGIPALANADRRIGYQWNVKPQDFTLYAIKYINPWHGTYLFRGRDDYGAGKSAIYRNVYVEKCEIARISTLSRYKAGFVTSVRQITGSASPGTLSMVLTFDNNNVCNISSDATSYAVVTGTGKFVKDGDTWGGIKQNALILSYSFMDLKTNEQHTVNDTLVVRDRNVKLETFVPDIK